MRRYLLISAMAAAGMAVLLSIPAGCHKATTGLDVSTAQAAQDQAAADPSADARPKGGAQVWAQNCMRCHNLRRPRERSDREWEVIVHHMRVRANLTAEEHRLILGFLKAAN